MIVYADILIVLNIIVDYFLLLLSSGVLHRKIKPWRTVLGAVEGGIFSLYIFLPQFDFFAELIIRISVCFIISFTVFGFVNLKSFLKASGIFFTVTCFYGGSMTAVWKLLKPNGMVINNSVVYFDISALALIWCTVIFYLLFTLLSRLFSSNHSMASRCSVCLYYKEKAAEFNAIVDTGNSIKDVFGSSDIIIADKTVANLLFGQTDININTELKSRYRAIPCTTVSGADILDGFRCDSGVVNQSGKSYKLKNPILAVSNIPLGEERGIVNPEIFQNVGGEYDIKNKKVYK